MSDYTIHQGSALDVLRGMPDASVQCCISSPPYYGLRSYQTEPQIWDGNEFCDHVWGESLKYAKQDNRSPELKASQGATVGNSVNSIGFAVGSSGNFCQLCNAWRGELGLEPTFQLYISHLIQIYAEVKRVLKSDGVCFVNLGDSYSGSGKGIGSIDPKWDNARTDENKSKTDWSQIDVRAKSLMNIPARFAIAMTDELQMIQRNEIIWQKPACVRGSTVLYAKTQKGIIKSSVRELVRLKPSTVQLWDGEKWNQVLQWLKNTDPQNLLEVTLRNGEIIHCTGEHLFPISGDNVRADRLCVGQIIDSCNLPDSNYSPSRVRDDLGWIVGLYLAEGSWDKNQMSFRIASHKKETERFNRVKAIAEDFGGSCTWRLEGGTNSATITVYSRVLSAVIQDYVYGRNARVKRLTNKCWKRNNEFLSQLLQGYLDGDGHFDAPNQRWRLGFTRNEYLASDIQTLAARLGYSLKLQRTTSVCDGQEFKTFKGELRFTTSDHHNCKSATEIVSIRRDKNSGGYYDIVLGSVPHLFATATGTLIHNCMPSSATDRFTVDFEPIFFFAKNPKYKFNQQLEPLADVSLQRVSQPNYANQTGSIGNGGAKTNGNMKAVIGSIDGRNKRTTWRVPFEPSGDEHFASYPTKLVEPMILAGTDEGDVVLDPFAGTGTTLLTALRNRREAVGIELQPKYVEILERRLATIQTKLF